jgi:hypothetical protein
MYHVHVHVHIYRYALECLPMQLLRVFSRLGLQAGIPFNVFVLAQSVEDGAVDVQLKKVTRPVHRDTWLLPGFNFTLTDVTVGTASNRAAYNGMKASVLNRVFATLEHFLNGGRLDATLSEPAAIALGLKNATRVLGNLEVVAFVSAVTATALPLSVRA